MLSRTRLHAWLLLAVSIFVSHTPTLARAHPDDARWSGLFGRAGVDGTVYAIHEYDGDLLVGGELTRVVDARAHFVARRVSDDDWEDISAGLPKFYGDGVQVLADFAGGLVAGGRLFSAGGSANHVATFDGTSWSALPGSFELTGTTSTVRDLVEFESDLIAVGSFSSVWSTPAAGVARWDGASWNAMGPGASTHVFSVKVLGTELYASGILEAATPDGIWGVLRWDGSGWVQLGAAFSTLPRIVVFDGELHAAAPSMSIGGVPVDGIARWTGSEWEPLAAPVQPTNHVIATGAYLYLAGWDEDVAELMQVVRWDGQNWANLGGGTSESVSCLGIRDGGPVVAGQFATLDGSVVNGLAFRGSSHWKSFGSGHGLSGGVSCQLGGDTLFLGGSELDLDGTRAGHLAEWDGREWHPRGQDPLPNGPVFRVGALARHDSRVVGVPHISNAQWNTETYVARLDEDGQGWTPLGRFMRDGLTWAGVEVLASHDGCLLAAGNFDTVDGMPIENLACWDGLDWSSWATNPGEWISDLVVWQGKVVVIGEWDPSNGGGNLDGPLLWDGGGWVPLAMGDIEFHGVQDLAVHEGLLAVSVRVWIDGDLVVIVRTWDGQSWTTLGEGFSNHVNVLHSFEGELFAGGVFAYVGETLQRGIARWDGATWLPLGSGLDPYAWVTGLASAGANLYLTGSVHQAGGNASVGVACWMSASPVVAPVARPRGRVARIDAVVPNPFNARTEIAWSSPVPGHGEIRIFDLRGRSVASLPLGKIESGPGRVPWTGVDHQGRSVASGVYLLELRIDGARADVARAVLVE